LSTNFVESASWPDDIKKEGAEYFNNWHFTDKPINWNGLGFDNPILNDNSINALYSCRDVLKFNGTDDTSEKSMMMRLTVHIIGDLHQPLHSSSYFSA